MLKVAWPTGSELSRRRAAALALHLLFAGCSSNSIPDGFAEEAVGPYPTNFRFTVANGLRGILGDPSGKSLAISRPRRVDTYRGATWALCLRNESAAPKPESYYSVFIQLEKIIFSRNSVGIDHCEHEIYLPFDWVWEQQNPIFK